MDTARVTRPHTGFPFLDAGRDEGAVLAFAHRGGAHHPDLAGLENTLVAFDHAVTRLLGTLVSVAVPFKFAIDGSVMVAFAPALTVGATCGGGVLPPLPIVIGKPFVLEAPVLSNT